MVEKKTWARCSIWCPKLELKSARLVGMRVFQCILQVLCTRAKSENTSRSNGGLILLEKQWILRIDVSQRIAEKQARKSHRRSSEKVSFLRLSPRTYAWNGFLTSALLVQAAHNRAYTYTRHNSKVLTNVSCT
jgi:hypothetical protein